MGKRWLSPKEVAELAGCSERTIYRRIKSGELACTNRVGGTYKLDKGYIYALLDLTPAEADQTKAEAESYGAKMGKVAAGLDADLERALEEVEGLKAEVEGLRRELAVAKVELKHAERQRDSAERARAAMERRLLSAVGGATPSTLPEPRKNAITRKRRG